MRGALAPFNLVIVIFLYVASVVFISGCSVDRKESKVDTLTGVLEVCKDGGTSSLKVHVGTWFSYTEVSCTWENEE